jgi:hypothetical protein
VDAPAISWGGKASFANVSVLPSILMLSTTKSERIV